jgi:3-oxoacyl-[acyl-carrier-protein] synthase-3
MKVFVPAHFGQGVRLRATGAYLPATVLSNADVVARGSPLSVEEIETLSGILERRHAAPEEATSDLALAAARQALERAGVAPAEVERLIVATTSPDHLVPSTACLVQEALGLPKVPAYDLSAACSGFLYALDAGVRAVVTGETNVLVVSAEIRSRYVSPTDRATAALFGDGAAAALLEPCEPGAGLLALGLRADGSGAMSVHIPAGGSREPTTAETVAAGRHTLVMADGPQVYFSAVEGMLDTSKRLLAALDKTWDDVALVVPHQPNARLLKRLARVGKFDPQKLFLNVERYGNTSGAACPIALDEALGSAELKPGDEVMLLVAGAGYTAGAALLRVDEALLSASGAGSSA